MEQKDYDEIAKIFKEECTCLDLRNNILPCSACCVKVKLADYLEKEDKKGKECKRENSLGIIETYYIGLNFDKQHFLKGCE